MNTPVVTKPLFVICIPIYNGVDLMDVAAPTEVFTCLNESWREKQVVIYHVAEVERSAKQSRACHSDRKLTLAKDESERLLSVTTDLYRVVDEASIRPFAF